MINNRLKINDFMYKLYELYAANISMRYLSSGIFSANIIKLGLSLTSQVLPILLDSKSSRFK